MPSSQERGHTHITYRLDIQLTSFSVERPVVDQDSVSGDSDMGMVCSLLIRTTFAFADRFLVVCGS